MVEQALLRLSEELHRRVPSPNLCLAGGVALNVVANSRILREGPFERIFVQPAAGDAGGALGAALEVFHGVAGGPRGYVQEHAFLGQEVVAEPKSPKLTLPGDDDVVEEMVTRLAAGKTLGWVRGAFEWGPRSLGHRSLLADPRRRTDAPAHQLDDQTPGSVSALRARVAGRACRGILRDSRRW